MPVTPPSWRSTPRRWALLLTSAELALPVRSCPGWTLTDLGQHVGAVYQHKIAVLRTGTRPDPWPPEPLPDLWEAPVSRFLATSAGDLLRELAQHDPPEPCWTWYAEDQSVGFWGRRMAQETVIHLWDAQDAVSGRPAPIEDSIAVDGIDELLVAFLAGDWSDEAQPGPYGTVEIRAGSEGWRVGLGPEEVTVSLLAPGAAPADAADAVISDSKQGMMLALWGRRPMPTPEPEGKELVDALRARLLLVTD